MNYTWNNADQIATVANNTLSASVAYDAAGRRQTLSLPNGVSVNYTYDNDSRITELDYSANATPLGSLTYSYDADGRIVGKGGSLAAVSLPLARNVTYNSTNQIATWNGTNATSDAANNLTFDPYILMPYAWDERNQLSSAAAPDYSFFYDALGRRETFDDFGVITSYIYDALMAVANSASSQPPSSQSFLTMPDGEVLAYSTISGSTTSTFTPLTDALGSTLGLVDSSGSLVTQYAYEPFGAVTLSGLGSNYPYLFAGMEYDGGTGLYHTYARYYSPILQRFLSEDPLQFGGGDPNLFIYAEDNPPNMADPSGNWGVYGNPAPVTSSAQIGMAIVTGGEIAVGFSTVGLSSLAPGGGCGRLGHPCFPTQTGTLSPGQIGISQGQMVLAQEDEEEGPSEGLYYPDEEPSTPEAWGRWKIAQNTSEIVVRDFLDQAKVIKAGRAIQFQKSGGFAEANSDFDRITGSWGLGVKDQGNGIRSTTLPNGTTISVRPQSTEGSATIQISVPGQPQIKIRY